MNDPRHAADLVLITDLVARVAHTADDGTPVDYLALFTPDAVWEMPGHPAAGVAAQCRRGHAEIAAGVAERRASGIQGPGTATRHVVTGTAVDPDRDRATAVSCWRFYASTDGAPRLVGMGLYHDEFVRVAGRWLLARRRVTLG
ncbi:nuclear transport factor 2 family protein [Lentzea albidocapillata]|uniref:SnoaL-like domain-containing protein n=1 Tax=Lentzea albidocapillata TaxID=40571 RepID=A0A1W2DFP1_9PSEU|nr:nuclear transport factor 2 family protein [Lentzea albidocapillata]SMC96104.1 SnoaL-like domain-containing protein [Lentzea albidocapillata]